MKKHRRNIRRISKRFGITYDEAILKFYKEKPNKNIIFSLSKKRNKGIIKKNKKLKKIKVENDKENLDSLI